MKRLIDEVHKRGMYIMVDVVPNHVAPVEDLSQIYPFNKSEYFHKKCPIEDWSDTYELEQCWLHRLPDLNQDHPFVRSYLLNWIKEHTKKWKFDGLRLDAVLHVDKQFWKEFNDAAGVFCIGEIFSNIDQLIGDYQNYLDSTMNFGFVFTI